MTITLTLDDSMLPFDGRDALKALMEALRTDGQFFINAADIIKVSGPTGIYTEDRT